MDSVWTSSAAAGQGVSGCLPLPPARTLRCTHWCATVPSHPERNMAQTTKSDGSLAPQGNFKERAANNESRTKHGQTPYSTSTLRPHHLGV